MSGRSGTWEEWRVEFGLMTLQGILKSLIQVLKVKYCEYTNLFLQTNSNTDIKHKGKQVHIQHLCGN